MGQKVNPHALRIGVIKDWDSTWYDEDCGEALIVDPTSAKPTVANRVISFNYSKVRQFIRAVMQKINERLILPRNKLLA